MPKPGQAQVSSREQVCVSSLPELAPESSLDLRNPLHVLDLSERQPNWNEDASCFSSGREKPVPMAQPSPLALAILAS